MYDMYLIEKLITSSKRADCKSFSLNFSLTSKTLTSNTKTSSAFLTSVVFYFRQTAISFTTSSYIV